MPDQQQWEDLALRAGQAFNPNTPITERSLFAGRQNQLRRIVDVVGQDGQHAIVFGERGVGKTSLANVISKFYSPETPIVAPRINCDSADTFTSVWRKVFDQIELTQPVMIPGFGGGLQGQLFRPSDILGSGEVTPDVVRRVLTLMSVKAIPILILDEFDRLPQEARRPFADTVKTVSDHAVGATIIMVGVGDSVDQLIAEHESVARALVQIQMPRMSGTEIREIITNGLKILGMSIDNAALDRIEVLAQGLPHYAHLFGLHASRFALDQHTPTITCESVDGAITQAIEDTQQSIRSAYLEATRSPHKGNLFADVLLACALAETDDLGFFAAQDVRAPMQTITNKPYDIPSYAQHLNEFSDDKRGRILVMQGGRRRHRFRFADPLMQPFVVMQGVKYGKVSEKYIQSRTIKPKPGLLETKRSKGSRKSAI